MDRPADGVLDPDGASVSDASLTVGAALEDQFQGYLDHLAIERGVAANTLSSYRRDLRRYREHLSGRGIGDLAAVTEAEAKLHNEPNLHNKLASGRKGAELV